MISILYIMLLSFNSSALMASNEDLENQIIKGFETSRASVIAKRTSLQDCLSEKDPLLFPIKGYPNKCLNFSYYPLGIAIWTFKDQNLDQKSGFVRGYYVESGFFAYWADHEKHDNHLFTCTIEERQRFKDIDEETIIVPAVQKYYKALSNKK